MTSSLSQIRDPLIGTRLDGRYVIKGVLGRGGMGVVYDGVHEQLGRAVAIKVLGPGVAGKPTAVQRFLREARTASQLTHGNIVDVSDLGTLPDGRPYLVMPKLQGTDLCSLLSERGPQTPRRTAELLRGAAAALDLVHAKGYVHRDVKPENLMHVVHDDGSEAVLLLDFGIVGLISPDGARLTAEGVVFGTPAYIAPEVVRGEAPTPRSDVYALAAVAFELITGQPPFVESNVMLLLQRKLTQAAPTLSASAGFALPRAVEEVIATSLEQDPDLRHASAGAFIAALHAAVCAPAKAMERQGSGLDDDARERLDQGTTELELSLESFGPSAPPSNQAVPTETSTQPAAARPTKARVLRVLGVIVAVCALAVVLWRLQAEPRPMRFAPSTSPAAPQTPVALTQDLAHNVTQLKAAPQEQAQTPNAPRQQAATPEPRAQTARPSASARSAPTRPDAKREPDPPVARSKGPSADELIDAAQDALVHGHMSAAQKLYEQATRTAPRNAAAFRGLGLVQERLGHKAEAIRALRRAIALAPNDTKNALLEQHIQKLETAP